MKKAVSKHMENIKKTRSSFSFRSEPDKKRIFDYVLFAILLVIITGMLCWKYIVKPLNEQRFTQASAQLLETQQQILAQHIENQLQQFNKYTQSEETHQLLQELSENANEEKQSSLRVMEQLILSSLSNASIVKIYFPRQAQNLKDTGTNIGFIELDMINRAEKNSYVPPEAAKVKNSDDWQIHWVTPFVKQNTEKKEGDDIEANQNIPIAVLYILTSMDNLEATFSNHDKKLAQFQLLQKIGIQRELTFLSLGRSANFQAQSLDIPLSHWKLEMRPSNALAKAVFYIPWWLAIAILALGFAAITLAFRLAKQKNAQQAAMYHVLTQPKETDASTQDPIEKDESGITALDDPLYLADAKLSIDQEDLDLVNGAHQEKNYEKTQEAPRDTISNEKPNFTHFPDHIFRSYDIRGLYETELSLALCEAIGKAIATEALNNGDKALVIGYDARSHSPLIFEHLKQGVLSTGCDILFCGLIPTPLLNFSVLFNDQTKSGIIITASHNPKSYNGFKIIINENTLADDDIQRIKERIKNNDFISATKGKIIESNYSADYIDAILSDIAVNGDLHVVIDGANGATSELAPKVFEELGCKVTPLFCEFDGDFPNHDPDPSIDANLSSLVEKVLSEKADLGIALDGDGDRVVIVSSSGKIIWPDILLMLFAEDVVSRNPGCDVIFDVKSTRQLNKVISRHGGRPIMWKTGHSHIKAKMRETEALLAGEFSGHIFFKERWFGFDDGIYAAARLLEIMSLRDQSLDSMLTALPSVYSTPEIKIKIADELKVHFVNALIKKGDFNGGQKSTLDGLRIDFDKGWGLVRPSNTSAALTLRFEAEDEESLDEIKNLFKRELANIDQTLQLEF